MRRLLRNDNRGDFPRTMKSARHLQKGAGRFAVITCRQREAATGTAWWQSLASCASVNVSQPSGGM
jgi:hypothetical protein